MICAHTIESVEAEHNTWTYLAWIAGTYVMYVSINTHTRLLIYFTCKTALPSYIVVWLVPKPKITRAPKINVWYLKRLTTINNVFESIATISKMALLQKCSWTDYKNISIIFNLIFNSKSGPPEILISIFIKTKMNLF